MMAMTVRTLIKHSEYHNKCREPQLSFPIEQQERSKTMKFIDLTIPLGVATPLGLPTSHCN